MKPRLNALSIHQPPPDPVLQVKPAMHHILLPALLKS
jgi:hypothetical protein